MEPCKYLTFHRGRHRKGVRCRLSGILYEETLQITDEMEWIDVKDRLPTDDIFEVLVKVDEPFFGTRTPRMIVAYYTEEYEYWMCDLTGRKVLYVSHWMPLPEPPK